MWLTLMWAPAPCLLPTDKGFFNCDSFPAVTRIY